MSVEEPNYCVNAEKIFKKHFREWKTQDFGVRCKPERSNSSSLVDLSQFLPCRRYLENGETIIKGVKDTININKAVISRLKNRSTPESSFSAISKKSTPTDPIIIENPTKHLLKSKNNKFNRKNQETTTSAQVGKISECNNLDPELIYNYSVKEFPNHREKSQLNDKLRAIISKNNPNAVSNATIQHSKDKVLKENSEYNSYEPNFFPNFLYEKITNEESKSLIPKPTYIMPKNSQTLSQTAVQYSKGKALEEESECHDYKLKIVSHSPMIPFPNQKGKIKKNDDLAGLYKFKKASLEMDTILEDLSEYKQPEPKFLNNFPTKKVTNEEGKNQLTKPTRATMINTPRAINRDAIHYSKGSFSEKKSECINGKPKFSPSFPLKKVPGEGKNQATDSLTAVAPKNNLGVVGRSTSRAVSRTTLNLKDRVPERADEFLYRKLDKCPRCNLHITCLELAGAADKSKKQKWEQYVNNKVSELKLTDKNKYKQYAAQVLMGTSPQFKRSNSKCQGCLATFEDIFNKMQENSTIVLPDHLQLKANSPSSTRLQSNSLLNNYYIQNVNSTTHIRKPIPTNIASKSYPKPSTNSQSNSLVYNDYMEKVNTLTKPRPDNIQKSNSKSSTNTAISSGCSSIYSQYSNPNKCNKLCFIRPIEKNDTCPPAKPKIESQNYSPKINTSSVSPRSPNLKLKNTAVDSLSGFSGFVSSESKYDESEDGTTSSECYDVTPKISEHSSALLNSKLNVNPLVPRKKLAHSRFSYTDRHDKVLRSSVDAGDSDSFKEDHKKLTVYKSRPNVPYSLRAFAKNPCRTELNMNFGDKDPEFDFLARVRTSNDTNVITQIQSYAIRTSNGDVDFRAINFKNGQIEGAVFKNVTDCFDVDFRMLKKRKLNDPSHSGIKSEKLGDRIVVLPPRSNKAYYKDPITLFSGINHVEDSSDHKEDSLLYSNEAYYPYTLLPCRSHEEDLADYKEDSLLYSNEAYYPYTLLPCKSYEQDLGDHRDDSRDHRKDSPDGKEYLPDRREYSPDHKKYSLNHKKYSQDRNKYSPDRKQYSPDRKQYSPDRKKYLPDHKKSSQDFDSFENRKYISTRKGTENKSLYNPNQSVVQAFVSGVSNYPNKMEYQDVGQYVVTQSRDGTREIPVPPNHMEYSPDRKGYLPNRTEHSLDCDYYEDDQQILIPEGAENESQKIEYQDDGQYVTRSIYETSEIPIPPDRKGYSPDRNGYSRDRMEHSPDRKGYVPDRRKYSPDRKGYSPDRKGYAPERKGYAPDRKRYAPARKEHSPDDYYEDDQQIVIPEGAENESQKIEYQDVGQYVETQSRYETNEIPIPLARKRYSPDRKGYSPDRKGYAPDRNRYAPDRNRYAPDRNRYAPDRKEHSPDLDCYEDDQQILIPEGAENESQKIEYQDDRQYVTRSIYETSEIPIPPNHKGPDRKGYSLDRKGYAPDRNRYAPDRNRYAPDRKEHSPDFDCYEDDQQILIPKGAENESQKIEYQDDRQYVTRSIYETSEIPIPPNHKGPDRKGYSPDFDYYENDQQIVIPERAENNPNSVEAFVRGVSNYQNRREYQDVAQYIVTHLRNETSAIPPPLKLLSDKENTKKTSFNYFVYTVLTEINFDEDRNNIYPDNKLRVRSSRMSPSPERVASSDLDSIPRPRSCRGCSIYNQYNTCRAESPKGNSIRIKYSPGPLANKSDLENKKFNHKSNEELDPRNHNVAVNKLENKFQPTGHFKNDNNDDHGSATHFNLKNVGVKCESWEFEDESIASSKNSRMRKSSTNTESCGEAVEKNESSEGLISLVNSRECCTKSSIRNPFIDDPLDLNIRATLILENERYECRKAEILNEIITKELWDKAAGRVDIETVKSNEDEHKVGFSKRKYDHPARPDIDNEINIPPLKKKKSPKAIATYINRNMSNNNSASASMNNIRQKRKKKSLETDSWSESIEDNLNNVGSDKNYSKSFSREPNKIISSSSSDGMKYPSRPRPLKINYDSNEGCRVCDSDKNKKASAEYPRGAISERNQKYSEQYSPHVNSFERSFDSHNERVNVHRETTKQERHDSKSPERPININKEISRAGTVTVKEIRPGVEHRDSDEEKRDPLSRIRSPYSESAKEKVNLYRDSTRPTKDYQGSYKSSEVSVKPHPTYSSKEKIPRYASKQKEKRQKLTKTSSSSYQNSFEGPLKRNTSESSKEIRSGTKSDDPFSNKIEASRPFVPEHRESNKHPYKETKSHNSNAQPDYGHSHNKHNSSFSHSSKEPVRDKILNIIQQKLTQDSTAHTEKPTKYVNQIVKATPSKIDTCIRKWTSPQLTSDGKYQFLPDIDNIIKDIELERDQNVPVRNAKDPPDTDSENKKSNKLVSANPTSIKETEIDDNKVSTSIKELANLANRNVFEDITRNKQSALTDYQSQSSINYEIKDNQQTMSEALRSRQNLKVKSSNQVDEDYFAPYKEEEESTTRKFSHKDVPPRYRNPVDHLNTTIQSFFRPKNNEPLKENKLTKMPSTQPLKENKLIRMPSTPTNTIQHDSKNIETQIAPPKEEGNKKEEYQNDQRKKADHKNEKQEFKKHQQVNGEHEKDEEPKAKSRNEEMKQNGEPKKHEHERVEQKQKDLNNEEFQKEKLMEDIYKKVNYEKIEYATTKLIKKEELELKYHEEQNNKQSGGHELSPSPSTKFEIEYNPQSNLPEKINHAVLELDEIPNDDSGSNDSSTTEEINSDNPELDTLSRSHSDVKILPEHYTNDSIENQTPKQEATYPSTKTITELSPNTKAPPPDIKAPSPTNINVPPSANIKAPPPANIKAPPPNTKGTTPDTNTLTPNTKAPTPNTKAYSSPPPNTKAPTPNTKAYSSPPPNTEAPVPPPPNTKAPPSPPNTKAPPSPPANTKAPPSPPPNTKAPPSPPANTKAPPSPPANTKAPPSPPPNTKAPTSPPPNAKASPYSPPNTKAPSSPPPNTKDPSSATPNIKAHYFPFPNTKGTSLNTKAPSPNSKAHSSPSPNTKASPPPNTKAPTSNANAFPPNKAPNNIAVTKQDESENDQPHNRQQSPKHHTHRQHEIKNNIAIKEKPPSHMPSKENFTRNKEKHRKHKARKTSFMSIVSKIIPIGHKRHRKSSQSHKIVSKDRSKSRDRSHR